MSTGIVVGFIVGAIVGYVFGTRNSESHDV